MDIQDAYDYYEIKSAGLGEKLLDALDDAFEILRINPNFQVRYDDVHCLPVKRFPYMIHFRIEGEEVLVYAILNTSLDPGSVW
ncbi:MAG: type II toxin-antitoxin system RelE/ParE family toxin [Cyclobacteriaceae bacterium]|nr:type II toxin-antitoxin system RelE/ParE family toxin [Cyclobacteriaceae bacterium]